MAMQFFTEYIKKAPIERAISNAVINTYNKIPIIVAILAGITFTSIISKLFL